MPFYGGGSSQGGGGGEPGTQTRQTVVFTTNSLAASARQMGMIEMASGYLLLGIETSGPARVRLYASSAQRNADASRGRGTDPLASQDHGLIFDYAIEEAEGAERTLSPMIVGATKEGALVPITIDNIRQSSQIIDVSLTFLRTE